VTQRAEEILELFDWTGLEVEFHPISLDRFKGLLVDNLSSAAVREAPLEERQGVGIQG